MKALGPDTNLVKLLYHHIASIHVEPEVKHVLTRPGYDSFRELSVNFAHLTKVDVVVGHCSWQIEGFFEIFWHVIALLSRVLSGKIICHVLNGAIDSVIKGFKIQLVLDIIFAD